MNIVNLQIGQSEILSKTSFYSIKLTRLVGRTIPKKFDAENIKYKVSLVFEDRKYKNLKLDDENINALKDGLLKIFYVIKKSYKKGNGPVYAQLNLGFDGLKKVYLKSGLVNIFDKFSHNIVYWLINQLDQVDQSSENLVFTKSFDCDFLTN